MTVGPMGRHVDDLVAVMRTLLQRPLFQLDETIPPIIFNEEAYSSLNKPSLIVGFYDTSCHPELAQTVPSVRRAIATATRIMKSQGHQTIRFNPPRMLDAFSLCLKAMDIDGGKTMLKMLKDEPETEFTKTLKQSLSVPAVLSRLASRVIKRKFRGPAEMTAYAQGTLHSAELQELLFQIKAYRKEFDMAWIDADNFDVLICPVWATPAFTRGTSIFYTSPLAVYCLLYNLLDYPAGVVPMGTVTAADVREASILTEEFKTSGDAFHEKVMQLQCDTEGLPLSVQIVARPFREELVLRVMKQLESGLESALATASGGDKL
ncbi:unnamed protein product [Dicrocoelium dendriticum]|nr:unnamed protein product [Dicrocoelium dendriticum]